MRASAPPMPAQNCQNAHARLLLSAAMLDFTSEATKKERRNLLATGCASILAAWLQLDTSSFSPFGLKFYNQTQAISSIALILALGLTILYFLFRFITSYLREESYAAMDALADEIKNGITAMDIARIEEELKNSARELVLRRKVLQAQLEHEKARLATYEEKAMAQLRDRFDTLINTLDAEKTSLNGQLGKGQVHDGQVFAQIMEVQQRLEQEKTRYQESEQEKLEELKKERDQMLERNAVQVRDLNSSEEALKNRVVVIPRWKKARDRGELVSPLHRFFDFTFPVIVGCFSLFSLVWWAWHIEVPALPSLPPF